MIQSRYIIFFVLFYLVSCSNLNFVYESKEDSKSYLYNKVEVKFMGREIPTAYKYSLRYFGSSDLPKYNMFISIEESTKKRSVQSNQAVSKLDYNLKFNYELISILDDGCTIFNKEIVSRFSYTPKSEGYNFGSDESLENMYELATKENFEKIDNFISLMEVLECNNES